MCEDCRVYDDETVDETVEAEQMRQCSFDAVVEFLLDTMLDLNK